MKLILNPKLLDLGEDRADYSSCMILKKISESTTKWRQQ